MKSLLKESYNETKFKTNLNISIQRLKINTKKKTELSSRNWKEIADFLKTGKIERARIRVEHIVREDYMTQALDVIEIMLEVLVSRIRLFTNSSKDNVHASVKEAIDSIIWASSHVSQEWPENVVLIKQIKRKLGEKYVNQTMNFDPFGGYTQMQGCPNINSKLVDAIEPKHEKEYLIEGYLEKIADAFDIPYKNNLAPKTENESQNQGNVQNSGADFDTMPGGNNRGKNGGNFPPAGNNNGNTGGFQYPNVNQGNNNNDFDFMPAPPNFQPANLSHRPSAPQATMSIERRHSHEETNNFDEMYQSVGKTIPRNVQGGQQSGFNVETSMVKPCQPAPHPASTNLRADIFGNQVTSANPTSMFQGTTMDRNAGLAPGYTVLYDTDEKLTGLRTFQREIVPEVDNEEDELTSRLNDLKTDK